MIYFMELLWVFFRQYQYFRVSADKPGIVTAKTASDAPEVEIPVLRPRARFPDGMPPVIPAAGLSGQRQQYLYKSVRPFVRKQYQDVTCPPPIDN